MKKLNNFFKGSHYSRLKRTAYLLFFVGYALIIFSDIFNDVTWLPSLNIVDVVAVACLSISTMCSFFANPKSFMNRKILILIIFSVIILATSLISNDRTFIKIPFLIFAFSGITIDSFISFDLACRSIMLLLILATSLLGINGNTVLEYRNGFVRNSFGMGHPNSFGFELSIICADILFLCSQSGRSRKNTLLPFFCIASTIVFNLLFLGSRTNILLLVLFFIIYLLRERLSFKNKIVFHTLSDTFLICFAISMAGVMLYHAGSGIGETLNALLSQRLRMGDYFLSNYGISLLGNNLNMWGMALDNAYLNLIIRFGILLTLFFIVIHYLGIKKLLHNHQNILAWIIISILLYGLSETPIYSPGKNPFFIILAAAVFLKFQLVHDKTQQVRGHHAKNT